jgi:hypothetical protein
MPICRAIIACLWILKYRGQRSGYNVVFTVDISVFRIQKFKEASQLIDSPLFKLLHTSENQYKVLFKCCPERSFPIMANAPKRITKEKRLGKNNTLELLCRNLLYNRTFESKVE